ncbi:MULTISPECIES: sulfite exporter TauE/SafE family protein [unclassified Agarivorans]|nr:MULTISPECIES: sulfite exporter TauE/SafE family protein [unclassified Agarivorans]MDO6685607.1 sulfite exporter TauE/SafE family protein [Agarivorans sp. 3_MG-2023]MDO6715993.1 sulfite exporter TauE/SafE family protein [Agarivorans sp. 2_MG-2023]
MITAIACLLIFVGALVQYTIGFGLAVIAAPLLFLLSPVYVPGPVVIVALVVSTLSAFEHRASISFKGLTAAILGRIPGSIAGGALLLWADLSKLSFWLGLSVLIAVAISLFPIRLTPSPKRLALAGFMSGFMGTSSSIGGPPMALLLQHQQASYLRANLSAFFVTSCIMSLIVQLSIGFMSLAHFQASLPLIPAALCGAWVGRRYGKRLPQQWMRAFSLSLCAISGGSAMVSYFLLV